MSTPTSTNSPAKKTAVLFEVPCDFCREHGVPCEKQVQEQGKRAKKACRKCSEDRKSCSLAGGRKRKGDNAEGEEGPKVKKQRKSPSKGKEKETVPQITVRSLSKVPSSADRDSFSPETLGPGEERVYFGPGAYKKILFLRRI
jgi:hypothetical protein